MWFTINNQDLSNLIDYDSIDIQLSLQDPLPTASFNVNDPGCKLNLAVGQKVIVWDEGASPSYTYDGRTIQTMPALNIIKNGIFNNNAQYWTIGGTNTGIVNTSNNVAFTYSNVANTSTTYVQQTTPAGYVVGGTAYCLSYYFTGGGTPTNIATYMQIAWLDSSQTLINTIVLPASPVTDTITYQSSYETPYAPSNAAYATITIGTNATVSGTNSGSITVSSVQFEPAWFDGLSLSNGAAMRYPTPDCNNSQGTSVLMPDGTCSRMCRIFAGTIKDLDINYSDSGASRIYQVDVACIGDLIENGAIISASFNSQTDASIINSIASANFAGLLSVGQMNIAAPTSTLVAGQVVDMVSYVDQTFREILNGLTDLTGFAFFVDPYGYIHYNDTPFDYAPFVLSDTTTPNNTTVLNPIDWEVIYDGTQLKNSVKVTGGQFQVAATDTFNGDGATKVFNLTNIPVSISNITIAGSTYAPTSANKIGTSGTDVNGTNGIVVLYDKQAQKVTFNTAPASGTANVSITYPTLRNVNILVEDNYSIALLGRRYSAKVNDTALTSNATARTRGESEIAKYAYPLVNLKFKLTAYVFPGTTIMVTSTLDNISNQPFVVQTVACTSVGGGTNLFEYEAGIYRPSLHDHLRNHHKAIARNTSVSGTTTVAQTYEIVAENTYYADATATHQLNNPSLFGVDKYGLAAFS